MLIETLKADMDIIFWAKVMFTMSVIVCEIFTVKHDLDL